MIIVECKSKVNVEWTGSAYKRQKLYHLQEWYQ